MPNGTYGGVRGKGAKAKTLAPRPTQLIAPKGRGWGCKRLHALFFRHYDGCVVEIVDKLLNLHQLACVSTKSSIYLLLCPSCTNFVKSITTKNDRDYEKDCYYCTCCDVAIADAGSGLALTL